MGLQDNSKATVIPDFLARFCPLLLHRLYNVTERYHQLNHEFTLILYIKETGFLSSKNKPTDLVWAATEKQRELLEFYFPTPGTQIEVDLSKQWELVKNKRLPYSYGITGKLLKLFDQHKLKLKDVLDLKQTTGDYFSDKDGIVNEEYKNLINIEDQIYSKYFPKESHYLPIPLIGFGKMDGVIHLLFKQKYKDVFEKNEENIVRTLIQSFSMLYETMILNWDMVKDNMYRDSVVDLNALRKDKGLYKIPLLKELNFREYYEQSRMFLEASIERNNAIPQKLLEEHRNNGVASILIDSFAHNIGAHSLTAQAWWFQQRAEYVSGRITQTDIPISSTKVNLSEEIYPMLKFLRDKSAFWNGITKKHHFGGTIESFYKVLWTDFINNPFYLGSLTYTDGIKKINIHLTIFSKKEKIEGELKRVKTIEKIDGVLLDGIFATVDITKEKKDKKSEEHSQFIDKNKILFEPFKKYLEQLHVFLPGGTVGRHAFYTILENEMRNVKHLKLDKKNQELTLGISIEKASYEKKLTESKESQLYKVGIWLNHEQTVTQRLVENRLIKVGSDIINRESFFAKLGGLYQDKVCAALLINNTFSNVNDQNSKRGKVLYPWIKAGFCSARDARNNTDNSLIDYEYSWRRLIKGKISSFKEDRKKFERQFETKQIGYFKKYIHLWQGEEVHKITKKNKLKDIQVDNYSRFKFLSASNNIIKDISELTLKYGVVRVIEENVLNDGNPYMYWMQEWIGNKSFSITIRTNNESTCNFYYTPDGVSFEGYTDIRKENRSIYHYFKSKIEDKIKSKKWNTQDSLKSEKKTVNVSHNEVTSNDNVDVKVCRYKSHGCLKKYFFGGLDLAHPHVKLSEKKIYEFIEMVTTKICIFDDRIHKRVEGLRNLQNIKEQLHLEFYPEEKGIWKKIAPTAIKDFHFLVVHLSFIELLEEEYREKNIKAFIEKELLGRKQLPERNFMLVITTGRARTHWYNILKEGSQRYAQFTLYRPVNELIAAVENAVMLKDDFELKYELTKVLFGS